MCSICFYRTGKFTLRMSRDSYNHLKRHLLENKQSVLLNIVNEHLFVDGEFVVYVAFAVFAEL